MKHIPNILTIFRIVLIPVFTFLVYKDNLVGAAIILILSGITDVLDGFLARRNNWVSELGKSLDPLADKLTQITVSVAFMMRYPQFWMIFAIMLLKEVVMILLGGYVYKKGAAVHGSRWFGKATTCLFYCSMILLLFVPDIPEGIVLALLILNLAFAIFAALMYLPDFNGYRKSIKDNKENK